MLVKTVSILALSYFCVVVLVYFLQGRLLYIPRRTITDTPQRVGLDYEELTLQTADRETVAGWYVPAKDEKAVLLFCHGNAGNISHRLESILLFHRLGLSVLIFDYRGYGKSSGRPSEAGTYLDAEAAWEHLLESKNKSPGRIIVFGRSLGSAVAAELCLRKQAGLLILESGFTSVADLGSRIYPWLPVRLLSKYRYATADKVGRIPCPKLIIHSPADDIIPFSHGRQLFEKAAPPRQFLEISGGHNEGFLTSGRTYTDGIRRFMDRYLSSPGSTSRP